MGRCLRNLYPTNWRSRRWRQSKRSASVGLFLSSLALVVATLNRPYPNLILGLLQIVILEIMFM